MANTPLSMLQIRRILQMKEKCLFSKRQISKELGISRNTVDQYFKKIDQSGYSFSELSVMPDNELCQAIQTSQVPLEEDRNDRYHRLHADIPDLLKQLRKPGVTRQLLWREYYERDKEAYSYGHFCDHLSVYMERNSATMHFTHQAGENLQVDFAGKTLEYVNRDTGEVITCAVLVCTLPFSGEMYVEALPNMTSEQLFSALNRCMDYLGGVPKNVLFDNLRQVVIKSCRYEPSFSDLSQQWALHYSTNITATRVAKPKDKPTVEKGVDLAYKRIYAPLRDKIFYSLQELNFHILQQLTLHNNTLFQKRDYSRQMRFEQEELQYLNALPPEHFVIKHEAKAKVQKNYHVILGEDWHQYSVPYEYIGKTVKLIYDSNEVEVYLGMQRIALHKRDYRRHGYTTLNEHMPEKHKHYMKIRGWDADYFMSKAQNIGEYTQWVMHKILKSRAFPEQSYNACLGILRCEKTYTAKRLEAACRRIHGSPIVNYGMINNILKNNLDQQHTLQLDLQLPIHENIRGANTYQ